MIKWNSWHSVTWHQFLYHDKLKQLALGHMASVPLSKMKQLAVSHVVSFLYHDKMVSWPWDMLSWPYFGNGQAMCSSAWMQCWETYLLFRVWEFVKTTKPNFLPILILVPMSLNHKVHLHTRYISTPVQLLSHLINSCLVVNCCCTLI